MSEPLQVHVTHVAAHSTRVPIPSPGEPFTTMPDSTHYEVEVRAVLRSAEDYERWRVLLGRTLTVSE